MNHITVLCSALVQICLSLSYTVSSFLFFCDEIKKKKNTRSKWRSATLGHSHFFSWHLWTLCVWELYTECTDKHYISTPFSLSHTPLSFLKVLKLLLISDVSFRSECLFSCSSEAFVRSCLMAERPPAVPHGVQLHSMTSVSCLLYPHTNLFKGEERCGVNSLCCEQPFWFDVTHSSLELRTPSRPPRTCKQEFQVVLSFQMGNDELWASAAELKDTTARFSPARSHV